MTKERIVFVVDVSILAEDGLSWEVVATNVTLRKPVWYDNRVIRAELLKQHPQLGKFLEGKIWELDIIHWI